MRVLIVGATGMLGYSLFSNLSEYEQLDVYGTARSLKGKESFYINKTDKIITDVDVTNPNELELAMETIKPNVVINCIGLIKQHDLSKQYVDAITINSLLPHKLASICDRMGAKLIHFSTDCVFTGNKGGYLETDIPDAQDLYGKSKCLGEVDYAPHLTLRTSIIGHELSSSVSLIDWFLSQQSTTKGFSKAIFSGLPTCSIAKILAESILPNMNLNGLYQLSVDPIDKYSLLKLVASIYDHKVVIEESMELVIDRSLNSDRLRKTINLKVPTWDSLIIDMYSDYKKRYQGLT
ncbi:NAD(P)-dependent oxidoreductase [Psychrosphaera saromensis]|uniref:dTDP-4-dehydrorhamnose reductase n=1 Tax=Psychrosphaera saromensis TaxID=716813 RepID=A0A2S7UZP6_9GAMM|nr:SDR family oxidoreductase [Psychrosphaera saromensis]PQJ54751.1 NAD(P)-dependent oxidoreductase [Psychrosphaera saromensis]GHB57443.1 NAD(P)-dependent oxidoreductase [Psychrosphaera saromensis]GLQ14015.1 NAD(P)-dependent oxidoreductase [Psychrosphaera saromensis]